MQGPQAGARVRVHRVGEPPPCLLLHGEGVRRAAGPAQGEHQQFGEAFARWVGRDEPDEFVDVLEGTAAYAGVLVVVTAIAGAVLFLPAALAAGGTGWSVPPRPPPASGSAPRSRQGGARPHRRHPARGRRGHPARPAGHGRGRDPGAVLPVVRHRRGRLPQGTRYRHGPDDPRRRPPDPGRASAGDHAAGRAPRRLRRLRIREREAARRTTYSAGSTCDHRAWVTPPRAGGV